MLKIIPGAGHMANLEQPELFNAALLDFLGSLP
jgi:pimeloyl-ACP methyl ester carboxylesterase